MTTPHVIIVGAGNAALCAATAAAESGAKVVVLESASANESGGNSRFTAGIFRFTHQGTTDLRRFVNGLDDAVVTPYDAAAYTQDLFSASSGRTDHELAHTLVTESRPVVDWLTTHGISWQSTANKLYQPGAGQGQRLHGGIVAHVAGSGKGLVAGLVKAATAAGASIEFDSPVRTLLQESGAVTGVVTADGRQHHGRVILASGGFEANPRLRAQYLGHGWDLVKVRGSRHNTGRMLEAAIEAGAHQNGNWSGCHASPIAADAPQVGDLSITNGTSRYSYPFGVLVNDDGLRFMDEGEDFYHHTYAKTGVRIMNQPTHRAWQIFDQRAVPFLEPRYENSVPVVASTIRELAALINVDADQLTRTVTDYNDACTGDELDPSVKDGAATAPGLDPRKSNWAIPIDQPPFVAYPVTCGITFTYGGLSTDGVGRALDSSGNPITGLYAVGEMSGGLFYGNYPGGAGLMKGSVFGRRAGRHAATS